MTQLAHVGSFLTGTATATTQVVVTGVVDGDGNPFTPKAVILWWNGLDGSGNILQRNNIRAGFGFAVSSTDRRNTGGQSTDAAATMSTDHQTGDESCVRVLGTTGALAGALDVVSMDSGGFTLVVDTQFAVDLRVHYKAIGGTSITDVKTGLVEEPAATGTQATTGLGFAPDVLLFACSPATGASPTQAAHFIYGLGFAVRSSGQALAIWRERDATANSTTLGYGQSGAAVGRIAFDTGVIVGKASVDSFDADGFTLNWTARAFTGVDYFYLAIKGGDWACGELLTQTDTTTTIPVMGMASPPAGILFASVAAAEHTTGAVAPSALSIGAATAPTARVCTSMISQDALADATLICGQRTDAVYLTAVHNNPTPTVRALMDVQSFDAGGFTCIMDDAETVQTWVGYLAMGGGTASGGPRPRSFVGGMIG